MYKDGTIVMLYCIFSSEIRSLVNDQKKETRKQLQNLANFKFNHNYHKKLVERMMSLKQTLDHLRNPLSLADLEESFKTQQELLL